MYPTEARPYFGIFVREFVDSLRGLGVDVTVFFTDASGGRAAYLSDVPRLRGVLAHDHHDVIHAQHTYSMYQLRLARMTDRRRTPIVFTIHEGESLMPSGLRDGDADFLKRLVYFKKPKLWALNMARHVVSVNEHIPRALSYRRPYSVIAAGVDLELFKPGDRDECRRRIGLSTDKPVLFFPAEPSIKIKGFDLVQESLTHLPFEVTMLTGGRIPHEEMPYYMNAADLVIQKSSFEASPMVVKEAMAVGVPMVSTDVGDIRTIFGETPGYYLCGDKPADVAAKIKQALGFKGRTRGRERILELGLSLEQVATEYLKIYGNVVSSSSGRTTE
jgi:glycosyltransferase involved in cell wall biosynthesis